MTNTMSAFGTKRTSLVAPHMSAIGGKADIARIVVMSAFDPKRTWLSRVNCYTPNVNGGLNETAGISWRGRRRHSVVSGGTCPAASSAVDRVSQQPVSGGNPNRIWQGFSAGLRHLATSTARVRASNIAGPTDSMIN